MTPSRDADARDCSDASDNAWQVDFLAEACDRNLRTRHLWQSMQAHRSRLCREIAVIARGGRLCILGAGNCNDVDLRKLLEAFDEIHLADFDGGSVVAGVERQRLAACPRIHTHGDAELTGILAPGLAFGPRSSPRSIQELTAKACSFSGPSLPGPFDVVVSTCVLSQIVCEIAARFDDEIGSIGELMLSVRNRHIDIVLDNTAPGGAALVVSDMVSTDTAPEIETCPAPELARLRDRLLRAGNFFHGTNPHAWQTYVATQHPEVRCDLLPPWLWSLTSRSFLVNALRLERRKRT